MAEEQSESSDSNTPAVLSREWFSKRRRLIFMVVLPVIIFFQVTENRWLDVMGIQYSNKETLLYSRSETSFSFANIFLSPNSTTFLQRIGVADTVSAKTDVTESKPRPPTGPKWVKVNQTNKVYASDILCKESSAPTKADPTLPSQAKAVTGPCQRQCDNGGIRNKIVYLQVNEAGLGDRTFIFDHLMHLAGYLCATLYLPGPVRMLAAKHNHGKHIDKSLAWSDFLTYSLNDKGYPIRTSDDEVLPQPATNKTATILRTLTPEEDKFFNQAVQRGAPVNITLPDWDGCRKVIASPRDGDMVKGFQRALKMSMFDQGVAKRSDCSNEGFVWILHWKWFKMYGALERHLKKAEKESPTRLFLPMAGTSYTTRSSPSSVEEIADKLWNNVIIKDKLKPSNYNDTSVTWMVGSWHIRRGDTKGRCNTGLERMEKYIKCTLSDTKRLLNNTNTQIAIIVQTDETDTKYLKDLDGLVRKHASHVRMIFVDDMVRDYFKKHAVLPPSSVPKPKNTTASNTTTAEEDYEFPSSYQNNFHTYMTVNALAGKASAFRLEHRRHFNCKDCKDITDDILKRLKDKGNLVKSTAW